MLITHITLYIRGFVFQIKVSSAPDIHEGTIVLNVLVGFTDAQQEGEVIDLDSAVILRRSTKRKYAFQAWGRGWGVCTSTRGGGEGGGSALGCVIPRDLLV